MHPTCIGIQADTLWQLCAACVMPMGLFTLIGWQLLEFGKSIEKRRVLKLISECQRERLSPSLRRLWAGVLSGELPPRKEEGESQTTDANESAVEETSLGNENKQS